MKHLFISAFLAILLLPASAQEQSPAMVRFAKAIGVYEQIDAQKAALSAQTSEMGQEYIQQIMSAVPEAPDGLQEDLNGAFGKMTANIAQLIDTERAAGSYLTLMEQELSAKEIKKITRFYESKLGQKFTDANARVMGEWTTSFSADVNERARGVIDTYIGDLKDIVGRYQSGS